MVVPPQTAKNPAYPCVHCKLDVSGRQHALSCSVCNRWQHRKCHTGIDHVQYRLMTEEDFDLKWKCIECQPSPINSKVGREIATKDEVEKVPKTHRLTARVNYTENDLINTDSDDSDDDMDFEGFEKNPAYPCVYCKMDVSGRQHALSCTVCNRWQHRNCHTGINHAVYRRMMKGATNLKWKCFECRTSSSYSNVGGGTVKKVEVEKVPKTHRPTAVKKVEAEKVPKTHRPMVKINLEKHKNNQVQNRENNTITDKYTEKQHINANSDDSNDVMDFEGFERSVICKNHINTDHDHYTLKSYMNKEENLNTNITNIINVDDIERGIINMDSDEELDIECIRKQLNKLPCKPGEKCTCTTDFTNQVPNYILDLFKIMPEICEDRIIIVDDDQVICL